MKIIDRTSRFKDLEIGETFELNGHVCIKLPIAAEAVDNEVITKAYGKWRNAFDFYTIKLISVPDEEKIIDVDAELTVRR